MSKSPYSHVWTMAAVRIVLLCATPMLMTFVNDWLSSTGFFGDESCPAGLHGHYGPCDGITWSARHFWYAIMCVSLWLLGLAKYGTSIGAEIGKIEEQERKKRYAS